MARVNIDDDVESKPQFRRLVQILGDDDRALAMLVRFWRLAQKYWGDGELIPMPDIEDWGFGPVIESKWGLVRDGGVYAIGSEERFAWYRQRVEAGKKRAEGPRDESGQFQRTASGTPAIVPAEHQRTPIPDQPLVPSPSPVPIQNKETTTTAPLREKVVQGLKEQTAAAYRVWTDTLATFGVDLCDMNGVQENSLARAITQLGFESVCLALEGARHDKASKDYDPVKHLSIDRVLHRNAKTGVSNWERLRNLALSKRGSPRGGAGRPDPYIAAMEAQMERIKNGEGAA